MFKFFKNISKKSYTTTDDEKPSIEHETRQKDGTNVVKNLENFNQHIDENAQYQNETVGERTPHTNPSSSSSFSTTAPLFTKRTSLSSSFSTSSRRLIEIMAKGRNNRRNNTHSCNKTKRKNNNLMNGIKNHQTIINNEQNLSSESELVKNCVENNIENCEENEKFNSATNKILHVDDVVAQNRIDEGEKISSSSSSSSLSPPLVLNAKNSYEFNEKNINKCSTTTPQPPPQVTKSTTNNFTIEFLISEPQKSDANKKINSSDLGETASGDHADFVKQLVLDKYTPSRKRVAVYQIDSIDKINLSKPEASTSTTYLQNKIKSSANGIINGDSYQSELFPIDVTSIMGQPGSKQTSEHNGKQTWDPLQSNDNHTMEKISNEPKYYDNYLVASPPPLDDDKDIFYEVADSTANNLLLPDLNQLLANDISEQWQQKQQISLNEIPLLCSSELSDYKHKQENMVSEFDEQLLNNNINHKITQNNINDDNNNNIKSKIDCINSNKSDLILELVKSEQDNQMPKHNTNINKIDVAVVADDDDVNRNHNTANNDVIEIKSSLTNLSELTQPSILQQNDDDEHNNIVIENCVLLDLREELKELKKQPNFINALENSNNKISSEHQNNVKHIAELKNTHEILHFETNILCNDEDNDDKDEDEDSVISEKNAFNTLNKEKNGCVCDDESGLIKEITKSPKPIIRKFNCGIKRCKKQVTFLEGLISLPDVVESAGGKNVKLQSYSDSEDDDDEDNDDDEEDEDDDYENENSKIERSQDDDDDDDDNDDDDDYEVDDNDDVEYIWDHVADNTETNEDEINTEDSLSEISPYNIEIEEPISTEEDDDEEEITESDDEISYEKVEETSEPFLTVEMSDLVNQEERFSSQLEDAEKQKHNAELKIEDLQNKIQDLEREHSIKEWNVERLQAELIAACKESEAVRKKLKRQEEEMTAYRIKAIDIEEDLNRKYNELEIKFEETQEHLKDIQKLCNTLQMQLLEARSDIESLNAEKDKLIEERSEEQKKIQETIEKVIKEKSETEIKWKKEFEQLRNYNSDREEHLLEDCEWQLRNMQKVCKEKIELAEKEKLETIKRSAATEKDANQKLNEVLHLKSYEAEVQQLRGLTSEQRESLNELQTQINELKIELNEATERAETEIENMRKLKWRCEMSIIDNQRYTQQKIESETMAIACQWEDKLMEQMSRLTNELNQINGEERQKAVEEVKEDCLKQLREMKEQHEKIQTELRSEIDSLNAALKNKQKELEAANSKADTQLVEARMFLDRTEREHQIAMDRETEKREEMIEELTQKYALEETELEEEYRKKIEDTKNEYTKELKITTTGLAEKHKKDMHKLNQKLVKEREDALRELEMKHKQILVEAENKARELEISHQRHVEELKSTQKMERSILETRDHQNNKEIENLHRKCRCLTNLFEEMRMRYERRDPRPEDLREIADLRTRCEQQENDLRKLTESLREFQLTEEIQHKQQEVFAQSGLSPKSTRKNSPRKNQQNQNKRPIIDVIYEEVELETPVNQKQNGIETSNDKFADEKPVENEIFEFTSGETA